MRVLLLHNRYRLEGGEERAVTEIAALLERRGHEVGLLERSSAAAGRGAAARGLLTGGVEPDEVGAAVRRARAEVVHAHNLHPLFGWRALAAARSAGATTVLHLHNFRLFCAIGIAYRAGAPCFRCHHGDTRPGLRLRCRGPLGESALYAAGLARQLSPLLEYADRVVTVSGATADRLERLGLPPGRATVLPNFVRSETIAPDSHADTGEFALVAGRLVEEKGYDTAIEACRAAGVPLVIAGAGPDEPRLRSLAAGADVTFAGLVSGDALAELRARAAVVLAPSRWEEPCPFAVLEALAAGVPVLASDRGGLPELVGESAIVPAADADAWRSALDLLWREPERRLERGRAALSRVRDRFGEDRYYSGLLSVYGADQRAVEP